jgi:formylglycine-generating enzyme required for sulfatase activity
MPLKPLAFVSYVHIDDEYHGGAITEFRQKLSLAVRVITGVDFEVFQDRDGIDWGQNWRQTLDAALDEVRFLIPILTPSFFGSQECRRELRAFLEREAAVGRNDLVLPIHYVTCSVLEDVEKRRDDQLACALAQRQHRDWRELRHEPFTSLKVRRALEELALDIERALARTISSPKPMPKPLGRLREAGAAVPSRPGEPDDLAVIRDGDFAPELVVLPRGNFMMGSTETERQRAIAQGTRREWVECEKPQHLVNISYRFAAGRCPVSFDEWDRYANDDAWHRSRHMEPYRPDDVGWGRGKRPVINISWEDIQGYLRWLSGKAGHRYRLLSEAEWEYACRAGTTTAYPLGSGITHYDANFADKVGKTVEVGSYTPNEWGLCDMHGNVWEWVEDCWNESYEGAPDDGSPWTSGDCGLRMVRGGSWCDYPHDLRSGCRDRGLIGDRYNNIGFRVAITLP